MSNSEVLKELFVNLTYKIDGNSEKRFQAATRSAVIQAELIAKAVEKAAKAFVDMLANAAKGMDQLFYASDRIGASVGNIKSFSNAVAQLGGTVEGAQQSLENFGKFIRFNPGALNFIKNLGVNPSGDKVEVLQRLVQTVSKSHNYAVQMKYAEMFGIDENTWRAMQSGEFGRRFGEQKSILAKMGLDPEQMAKDSRGFMNAWRNISTALDAILDKVMANFLGDGETGLKGFQKFLMDHGKEIADGITRIVNVFVELIKQFALYITQDNGTKFNRQVSDIASSIKGAAEWTEKWIKQIRDLFDYLAKFNEESKDWWITKFLNYTAGGGMASDMYNGTNGKGAEAASGAWGGIKGWWGRHAPSWLGGGKSEGTPGKLTENQKSAYDSAIAEGLSPQAARAWVANISGESLANPGDVHQDGPQVAHGMVQWDGIRSRRIFNQFGKWPQQMSIAEQTKAAMWEMKKYYPIAWAALRNGSPQEMVAALVRYYEMPANQAAAYVDRMRRYSHIGNLGASQKIDPNAVKKDLNRGSPAAPPANDNRVMNNSQHVSQNNHIVVNGGSDPHETATAVSNSLAKTNRNFADLIRNTNGAAQ
ncbi:phage tail tip lysozyme [Rhodoblastus sp.]|uniref:phage tail tip lysozyme n=1 Tax=Rhodoblastus sp. TaxID=1962975 RepID=UPI003F95D95B